MPSASGSLADLERRAWRSTFDDGLFDLLIGAMLFLLGLATMVPNDRVLYPFYFGLVAVFWLLKWRVVIPRAGAARFAPARKRRKSLAAVVLLASTILGSVATALLAVGGAPAEWLRTHPIVFEAGFPLLVVAVFSALALLLDVARIHAIGGVVALAFGVQLWLGRGLGFLIGGAVVSLPGLVLFAGFLRSHPRPSTDHLKHDEQHDGE